MDEYLINKRRKIQDTNGHIEQISCLFKGKSFYLNGYLDGVGYGDFKALILKRGGIVYDYLSSKVTHIIASTMTNSKLIQIKKPIIKPDWIHDCILQDRIISSHSYLLNPLQNNMVLDFGKVDASENDSKELDLNDPFIRQNTTLDPDFLHKFFAKSRLHHLTSWKHELIDYVYQNMKNRNVKNYQKKSIMHVDLDAFFVSVSLLDKPHLRHLPVVIAHSSNQMDESTSEIASCNYVSRGFGIKNGMLLRTAKIKCPELHVLPYDFVKYRQVSSKFFDVLLKYANQIQVNSCDEAIIDVSNRTDSGSGIIEVAEMIRKDVFEATGGCSASVGCGSNLLMARLATYKAKPNGSFLVEESEIESFLDLVPVSQLPGIGWHHQEKLNDRGISTCKDLRQVSLQNLKNDLGSKTGEMLYNYSRGLDDRELENKGRQSLGVDINWGVRFQNQNQVSDFFRKITDYVSDRLQSTKLKASHITVKAKKRLYKGEPGKFLGCGHCESLSKSSSMPFTDTSDDLFKIGYPLFCKLSVEPIDLRGIGLSVKMFDVQDPKNFSKKADDRQQTILKFLSPTKADPAQTRITNQQSLDRIDPEVFEQLPAEIQQEIRNSRQFSLPKSSSPAKLKAQKEREMSNSFVTPQRKKRKLNHTSTLFSSLDAASPELTSNPGRIQMSDMLSLPSDYDPMIFNTLPSSIQREIRDEHRKAKVISTKELDMNNLLPSSSQLDLSVLNELPASIRKEILDSKYKKHRKTQFIQSVQESQQSSNLVNDLATNNLMVSNFSYPALGGETDPFAIYELLDSWVACSPHAPQDEGILELKKYLKELSAVGDLVRIRNILLFLERRLCINGDTTKSNTAWNSAYSQIYSYIHQIIESRHGARLDMKI